VNDDFLAPRPRRIRGKWSNSFTTVFGFFEFAWAGISFLAWGRADHALPRWLPVSLIACILAGAAAGIVLIVQQRRSDDVLTTSELTMRPDVPSLTKFSCGTSTTGKGHLLDLGTTLQDNARRRHVMAFQGK